MARLRGRAQKGERLRAGTSKLSRCTSLAGALFLPGDAGVGFGLRPFLLWSLLHKCCWFSAEARKPKARSHRDDKVVSNHGDGIAPPNCI
jgi:hypothetical protein